MKKIVAVVAMLLSATLILSSCTNVDLFRSADSLLSPPLYFDEYEGLVEVIKKDIGSDSFFCTPFSGDYKSGIIVEDIDGDSKNEAIVLYCDGSTDQTAKVRFYEEDGKGWSLSSSYIGYGNQVESVKVKDFDVDGVNEIVILWATSGVTTSRMLTVYHRSEEKGYKEISNEACSATFIADVDGDLYDEIFLVTTPSNNPAAPQRFARIFGIYGGAAVLKGETKVDANISGYAPIQMQNSSDGSALMIYIDAYKGERQMLTEIIYWDSEKDELCNAFFDNDTMSTSATLRYDPIPCSDINNDGIIDVPYQVEVLSSNVDPLAVDPSNVYITSWLNCYPDGSFVTVANALVNVEDGYKLMISNEERYSIGLDKYSEINCWTVYEKNTETGEKTELYSLMKVTSSSFENANYVSVLEADGYIICVNIYQGGAERGITAEQIKEKISKL